MKTETFFCVFPSITFQDVYLLFQISVFKNNCRSHELAICVSLQQSGSLWNKNMLAEEKIALEITFSQLNYCSKLNNYFIALLRRPSPLWRRYLVGRFCCTLFFNFLRVMFPRISEVYFRISFSTLIWVGSWVWGGAGGRMYCFPLNNSETVRAVTLVCCSIH